MSPEGTPFKRDCKKQHVLVTTQRERQIVIPVQLKKSALGVTDFN